MNEVTRCPNPTCSWQWRHYPSETDMAATRLTEHLAVCVIATDCTSCGAVPGEACRTRNDTHTHRPHLARRRAA